MKLKLINLTIIILIILFASACVKKEFEFTQAIKNVEKIEVILIGMPVIAENRHEQTILYELTKSEFASAIEAILDLDSDRLYTSPATLFPDMKAFKITYKNGDYEIINNFAQGSLINGIYKAEGYYTFDIDEFNELIDKYLNKK